MELAETLPSPAVPNSAENLNVREKLSSLRNRGQELKGDAADRWMRFQMFLGKRMVTTLLATEATGAAVDVGAWNSGVHEPVTGASMHDPFAREPMAAGVDALVLSRLFNFHKKESGKDINGRKENIQKWAGIFGLLGAVLAAQKTGLYVSEHTGLGNETVAQFGSKGALYGGLLGGNEIRKRMAN